MSDHLRQTPSARRPHGQLTGTRRVSPEQPFGFLSAPLRGRTWRETGYVLVGGGCTAIVGFSYAVSVLATGGALAVTVIGVPLLVVGVIGARGFGAMERALARGMLRLDVGDPLPLRAGRGARSWLRAGIADQVGWRALLYLLVRFPTAVAGCAFTCAFWSLGLFYTTAPLWWRALPVNAQPGFTLTEQAPRSHSVTQFGDYYVDTWSRVLLFAVGGLLVLWLAPWVVRVFALLDGALVRGLLGPTKESERIRSLELSRAHAVGDAATQLRRIERELNDGAQARLVSLALNLGMAREQLAADTETTEENRDGRRSLDLVDAAHTDAMTAIVELRDLARGIRPATLDAGLEPALAKLTAHSIVPVDLRVELSLRPAQAIEALAFYCTAELLTNIAEHSGARHVTLHVVTYWDRLVLEVTDDGHGGARASARGGLAGLAERVRAVDGTLDLSSPPGGPTVVTIELPMTT